VRPEFSEANLPCCAFSWLQFEFQTAGAQYYEPGITADTLGCWQCLRNLTRFVPQKHPPAGRSTGNSKNVSASDFLGRQHLEIDRDCQFA
jgi:hypothetical protein